MAINEIFRSKLFIIFLFSLFVVSCQSSYQESGQKRQTESVLLYDPARDKDCSYDKTLQKNPLLFLGYVCFTDHGISFLSPYNMEMKPSNQALDQRANDYCTREFNSNARYAGKPNAGIFGGREYICG